MSNTEQHTPTPWTYNPESNQIWATDRRQTIVCSMLGSAHNPSVKADAKLIVKAVNSYQDMKEALEAVVDAVAKKAAFYVNDPKMNEAMDKIAKALNKAQ